MCGMWRRREEIRKMYVGSVETGGGDHKDGGSGEKEGGDQKRCGECGDGGKRSEKMCGVWRRREEIIKDVGSVETGGGDHKRCGECGDRGRRS